MLMKNTFYIILLALFFTNCSKNNEAEDDCICSEYYHYNDEIIYMENLNHKYLAIGFDSNTTDNSIIDFNNHSKYFESIVSDDIRKSNNQESYIIAKFKDYLSCSEITSVISELRNNEITIYASKTYVSDFFPSSGDNKIMFAIDQFIIKLDKGKTKEQLNILISETEGVSIINVNNYNDSIFLLSNKSKSRSTFETLNLFYDSDLLEFSEPNLYYMSL